MHVGLDESDISGGSVLSLCEDLVGGEREKGGEGGSLEEHFIYFDFRLIRWCVRESSKLRVCREWFPGKAVSECRWYRIKKESG